MCPKIRFLFFATILLAILPIVTYSQISYVSHALGLGPVSRGSLAVIRGVNLAPVEATSSDPIFWPLTLGGVTVTLDGLPCQIYSVSPTEIRIVIPDEAPFPTYVLTRFGWYISPNVLRVQGFTMTEYRFHLTDTAPWWYTVNGKVIGSVMTYMGPVGVVENGVIPIIANTSIVLRASGARSFRPPEWIFYKVLFFVDGELSEVDATVSKDVMVPGIDLVKFTPLPEWAGKRGLLFLQTPSAFSEGVAVEFR